MLVIIWVSGFFLFYVFSFVIVGFIDGLVNVEFVNFIKVEEKEICKEGDGL